MILKNITVEKKLLKGALFFFLIVEMEDAGNIHRSVVDLKELTSWTEVVEKLGDLAKKVR